ncbi:MAG: hypothetical protein H0T53_13380 [Herpetosiphonaceae bacterium]|nr:hypothetical protein [Herpetosiphonaceae bacterium]
MKHVANPPHSDTAEADELDALFRDGLRRELNVTAPQVALPQRQNYVDDAAAHRWQIRRGGGPGGGSYSGFYLLYYVMNTSRSAWGSIPG